MARSSSRLSPHFALAEFTSGDGARVPSWKVPCYRALCRDFLEPLREEFGPVVVTSGFRSLRHNGLVGGAPFSYHRAIRRRPGCAADVTCAAGTPADWYELLDALAAPGLSRYASFVHVDNRDGWARW